MHFHRNKTVERVITKMYGLGLIQCSIEIVNNLMMVVEKLIFSQKIKWKECLRTQSKVEVDNHTGKDWKTFPEIKHAYYRNSRRKKK